MPIASTLRHLLPALVALVLVAPVASAQPPDPAASRMTVVGTDRLNLRDCPETDCASVATLPLGAEVRVSGEEVAGFVRAEWQGRTGWAYRTFLADEQVDLVRQGVPGCNRVALIFNAGIGEAPSETILDTLANTQRPATLFAMGWWAETWPDYLWRMATEANVVVGTHGHTQTLLTSVTDAEIVAEIHNSAAAIEDVLGSPPARYYTPYATDSDDRVQRVIAGEGYLPVGWTAAGADYHDDDTARGVYERVMEGATDGAIIELHLDGPATEQSTAAALPWIISNLEAEGYELVTVPDILLPCGSGAGG
jgi:peptidoglycan/xylan/chitin deacetylase (PgdA/CDA1 family)